MGKSQSQYKSSHHPDLITTNEGLVTILQTFESAPFLAIDTEFMREKTYYAQLCLIQVAGEESAFIIDALSQGLDLEPFLKLMADETVLKVFHAGRQDLEIFYQN